MQKIGFIIAPLLFIGLLLLPPQWGLSMGAWHALAVVLWVSIWWMTEAIPIPVTALLPMVLFPLLGIKDLKSAAAPFADPIIYLFLGGFVIAFAMQRHELHRRFALNLIQLIGTKPKRLLMGFMGTTALISMWISNTAATLMMLPIALSMVDLLQQDGETAEERNFVVLLVLSIAYGASIGGLGTLIGTAPNLVLAGFVEKQLHFKIGFAQWMLAGVPLVVGSFPIVVWLLTKWVLPVSLKQVDGAETFIAQQIEALGRWRKGEIISCAVFGFVVLGWIFQSLAKPLLGLKLDWMNETAIAMTGAILLFVIPLNWKKGEFVMDWQSLEKLPWDLLLLFGGGLSLAAGIQDSGLAQFFGKLLSGLSVLPFWLMVLLLVTLTIFLTEFTSNTALVAIMLPVLSPLATEMGIHPLLLLLPATLAASTGFMMPVGTPPNAIAYGTGLVTVQQMMRVGFVLNLFYIMVVTLFSLTLFRWAFQI